MFAVVDPLAHGGYELAATLLKTQTAGLLNEKGTACAFLNSIFRKVPLLECWNLTFLNDRLRHPGQWLSAMLLASLLVMATAGGLFMCLGDEIGEQAWLTQVDLAIAQFFHDHGTPWAVRLFEAITFFGNASTLGVVGLVTALVLAFQRRWSLLLGWVTPWDRFVTYGFLAYLGAHYLSDVIGGCAVAAHLAHFLHPRDRPDAKKVEHLQSTLTRCLRRYPTGIGRQSGEHWRGLCALPCSA